MCQYIALSGFTLSTPGRELSVLSLDGGNAVESSPRTGFGVGVLYPGERVDVLLNWARSTPSEGLDDHMKVTLDRE